MNSQNTTSPRPFAVLEPGGPLGCGKTSLELLAKRHGTPLYVYSSDAIAARLGYFQQAFSSRDHLVCFAVKSNSSLAVLKLLAARGAGFDIVSGGELERVLAADSEAASRVVFSGVGKTAADIDLALEAGILSFNVESADEIDLLAARAAKAKKRARFGFRVNPDVFAETHPYISTGLKEHKFGVDIRRAKDLYKAAARHRWVEPYGVSAHIGSQIRSADPFGAAAERLQKLARVLNQNGIELQAIDVGGGLGIDYHGGRFDAEQKVREYAESVLGALEGFAGRVIVEPGRFLVAQAGALLVRVLRVKQNGKKSFIVTDGGMNDLIRPALYEAYHEIVPVRVRPGRARAVDVVGPVCESGDFFARDRKLPPLEPGDLLAILDAGAYGMTMSSNYNSRLRAAEVLVEGAKSRIIRRRETVADMLALESL